VLECLYDGFVQGLYVDKAIERKLKSNRAFGARDRRFIAETTYDMTRWWRLLWRCLAEDPSQIDEGSLWRLFGAHLILAGRELPDWPEFLTLEKPKILDRRERAKNARAVRESIPDWLDALGSEELGPRWDEAIAALNRAAPVVLRANALKATPDQAVDALRAEEIEAARDPSLPHGIVLRLRKNVFVTAAFKQGLFEVQDGASQRVAPLLAARPGERVIDACAGAGGKSLHLAALMGNKGKILALDVRERKLEDLRKRAARAGADTIESRVIEGAKTIKRLEKSADRVLLDVPCSGLGVLRRNPEAKWKLSLEEIERLRLLQAEILESYSQMTKPGGRLVYATCSCLPSENERQVEAFLARHGSEWRLVEEMRNFPGEGGFDGFYAAALERACPS
jgi:16S rRNA (cytosine967-C5)-methyltransferase